MKLKENGLIIGDDGRARPPWAAADELLRNYYDTEWGMPVTDERGMFERVCLAVSYTHLTLPTKRIV